MNKIKLRFSDFNVNSKLAILIGIFLLSFIILGSVINLLFRTNQTSTIVVSIQRTFLENFNLGRDHFYQYELSGDPDKLKQSSEYLNKAIDIAYTFATIDNITVEMPRKEWEKYLYNHFKEGVNYDIRKIRILGNMIKMMSTLNPQMLTEIQSVALNAANICKKISEQIDTYIENKNPDSLAEIQSEFKNIHNLTETFSAQIYSFSDHIFNRLLLLVFLVILLLGTTVVLVSRRIANSISKPVIQLSKNFQKIAKGDLSSKVDIHSNNEIGKLSGAYMDLQSGLQNIIVYSQKVSRGDFSMKLMPQSDKDELTVALNKMAQRLEETKIRTDKETWLQKGISGLDDQMRGNFSVRDLSARIIQYLSNFLNIEMGAVYVYDEVLEHLELTGSVGINTSDVKELLKPGEGLIGKAALQKNLQVMDTTNKYHRVYSASGEMFPEKLYFLPMHYDNRIQAVIELATIKELTENKIEFLNLIAERISVNVGASVARYRHKELLDKSIEQTEILKLREEELNKKLEENRQIQEKLIQEKALLDSMLKTIPDLIHFKDINCKFLRISESLARFLGFQSSDEIIGKSDFDFYDEEDAKKYFEEEQQLIKSGKGFIDKINENTDENGNKFWTSVTKLPIYDETGKCIGTFSISKDISPIKQLEIEVQNRNEKLNIQQEELKATNEELKSQEEELRVANEELAEQTKVLTENQKSLKSQQEELQVINEELENKSTELEQQKKEISLKNENLLITQNELRQKAKELEQASQYKSEFLANMSHELRTPLNSLLILSKLLANNKKGNLTPEQIKSINIIQKSGKDLLDLINEILDLSKIEAGKMTYDFTDVKTAEIKTEINHTFQPVAKNKNLKLEVHQSENFPKTIISDRQRLMQILKNLLSNAFKFTSAGGIKVVLGIPGADISFVNDRLNGNNTYYISVEDSGVGIPNDKVSAIFEAFQQADGSISRKFGGTGLGLSISKQLVHVLGGEIHVKSTEGVGSVFTVYLPFDKNLSGETNGSQIEFKTPEPEKTEIYPVVIPSKEAPLFIEDDRYFTNGKLLVLLIHDEKDKAEKLINLCHKRDINALVAATIENGIKLAEVYTPQAIIISASLNDSDQFASLKKNKATSRLPLHLVSRIVETLPESMEELKTSETEDFMADLKKIESKLKKEFRQVLVVEDDQSTRETIQILFENKEIIIHEAYNGQQAYNMIAAKQFDCLILDLGLPDFSGFELLKKLKENGIPIPYVIVHTARELKPKELRELQDHSDSIVIKGVKSDERLMDEVTLFLHQVENNLVNTGTAVKEEKNNDPVYKGKKILVVDDDIRNVFALAQILEEREIEVLEAENGEVALEVLKNNSGIDLILMDIMMPVLDGYDTMTAIRNSPDISHIPIITLTAKAMKEDYQKAIDSGANDYISKPVDVDKLLSLLKIWLFK
jgi:PAS domain S-box-containing protein